MTRIKPGTSLWWQLGTRCVATKGSRANSYLPRLTVVRRLLITCALVGPAWLHQTLGGCIILPSRGFGWLQLHWFTNLASGGVANIQRISVGPTLRFAGRGRA